MRDVDPALVQQVLDVPQQKRVANVHHHRQADDLRRRLEVAEYAGFAHAIEGSCTRPGGKRILI